jgi:hypothetical protein
MTKFALAGLTLFLSQFMAAAANSMEVEGALSAFWQHAFDEEVSDDAIAVLDLSMQGALGNGSWHLYVEGTTTSRDGRVTAIYPESLADAGGAADEDGHGRIQISGLEYHAPLGEGELILGLIYPSGFTESADWANDETSQFVSTSFVNIQTTDAPDYALGLGYITPLTTNLKLSLLLSQAQGLGDLDAKYSTLFDNLDDYFYAAELAWSLDNVSINAAIWLNSLQRPAITGDGEESNWGANLSIGHNSDWGLILLRLGLANDEVSEAEGFWGLSWQYDINDWTLGVGASQTLLNDQLHEATTDHVNHYEMYLKYALTEALQMTFSIQQIENSGFMSQGQYKPDPKVFTVRLSYGF